FGLPAMLLTLAGAMGQQRNVDPTQGRPVQPNPAAPKSNKIVEQTFPPNGLMETAWKIEWDTMGGNGLLIKNAYFKRGPDVDWMKVLGECRVSELLVPYHVGSPRFWDVSFNFSMSYMTPADAGERGKLHVSYNGRENVPCVVEELKDRG